MLDTVFRSDVTVDLVQYSGSDTGICEAARVSTLGDLAATGTDPARNDGLINYLMRNRHGSPFEHNSMTFFIGAPIFVFREFHRHRVGWSYNEVSGRYSTLKPVFYVPGDDRNLIQTGKPGAYNFEPGTPQQHTMTADTLRTANEAAWEAYQTLLADGIAREVARMCLPVNIYSSMYATCNARSLMHFLSLRTHDGTAQVVSHPQREIEMVAEQMEALFAGLFPAVYTAFCANGRVAP